MAIAVEVTSTDALEADVIAVPLLDPATPLRGVAAQLNERLGGTLARAVSAGEASGEVERVAVLHVDGDLGASRLVASGVGPTEALTPTLSARQPVRQPAR